MDWQIKQALFWSVFAVIESQYSFCFLPHKGLNASSAHVERLATGLYSPLNADNGRRLEHGQIDGFAL